MSKAFTRESDDVPEVRLRPRASSPLPPGAKNYLTPEGASRLRAELDRLAQTERPRLAALPAEDAGVRQQLQELDERIVRLEQSLQTAVVVPAPPLPWDVVRFGATVTARERNGVESRYRIVGVDEADADRNWVSFLSPVARALLHARVGGRVRVKLPAGEQELEITGLAYE